ncbi:MAG TPA: methyltransferase domain-containing protein [Ignavibacteriales bacterium]|nr:methyltransferase domain-containing protein [Ignavibacteriales bacterium]
MKKILILMPEWLKEALRKSRDVIFTILYTGKSKYCPVCNRSFRKFRNYGGASREASVCVNCSSLERHRLVWIYFTKRTDLFDQKPRKFLHIAPERCFISRLRKSLRKGSYITADLSDPRASVKMDITKIEYPEGSFDAIYCSHVLEHVQDDRKALSEFYRILKKDGWAVIMVPIEAEITFEDPAVTDPMERERIFGQADHVRCYGKDFVDRLLEAGFHVTVVNAKDISSEEEIEYMGLPENEDIFFCTKN